VAEAIAQTLCQKGAEVDVRLVKNVDEVSQYQSVVLGSAVRAEGWWPEAIDFVKENETVLCRKPVAYYLTCLTLYQDTPKTREKAMGYFNPVMEAAPNVKPVDRGCFAGVFDLKKMNAFYRMIMKKKMKDKGVPEGDHRDWPAIKAWAEAVSPQLM
jgi:menaquinone-dependent protoporphyrinogen oxidase